MDNTERLVTQIIRGLVESRVLVKTEKYGLIIACGLSALVGKVVACLSELVLSAGRRIISAVRCRNPDDPVMRVIYREIVAMGSESMDVITNAIMGIIAFLRKLLNMTGDVMRRMGERGASFTERLGQRSLDFTSVSSVKRNE